MSVIERLPRLQCRTLSVELSKMQLLAQIMCQSKGQSSVAILRPETPFCFHMGTRYIIENSEEWIALLANLK